MSGEHKGDQQILTDGLEFCKQIATKFKDSITQDLISAIARFEAIDSQSPGKDEIATSTSQIGKVSRTYLRTKKRNSHPE